MATTDRSVTMRSGLVRRRVAGLTAESVIEVIGEVVNNEHAPAGVEVVNPEITVLAEAGEPPPLGLRRPELNAQLPTLLDHAAVALRHPPRRAVAQITSASAAGFRSILGRLGFTEIFTPKVVALATESGANVFPISWFGSEAYLAQSPQFYKQVMVGVFERVYEVAADPPGREALRPSRSLGAPGFARRREEGVRRWRGAHERHTPRTAGSRSEGYRVSALRARRWHAQDGGHDRTRSRCRARRLKSPRARWGPCRRR